MRRLVFMVIVLVLLSFSLAACASTGVKTADDMMETLALEGYTFDERDSDAMAYYESHVLDETYGLDATVKGLYIGYVNEDERWVEIVVLANNDQAEAYVAAIYAEGATGKLTVLRDSVVLITYSTETVNLFPVNKD
ncbi:MAG: hypothetical protein ABH890_02640 [Bacillota bacterium]